MLLLCKLSLYCQNVLTFSLYMEQGIGIRLIFKIVHGQVFLVLTENWRSFFYYYVHMIGNFHKLAFRTVLSFIIQHILKLNFVVTLITIIVFCILTLSRSYRSNLNVKLFSFFYCTNVQCWQILTLKGSKKGKKM